MQRASVACPWLYGQKDAVQEFKSGSIRFKNECALLGAASHDLFTAHYLAVVKVFLDGCLHHFQALPGTG